MESERSSFSRWLYIIPPSLLALITAVAYYPSLYYDFQFDDLANIQKHFNIRHNSFGSLFMTGSRWISYWLNSLHYQIGRFNPFYYRVGNVLIHISNGLLIFFILLFVLSHLKKDSFFKRNHFSLALITALLFLLHPVQSQTVSYVIQGQLEGMAMFAMLSMIYCFLRLTHTAHTLFKIVLTGLLFTLSFLACGTKEIAIIAPALLMLIDWFFIAHGSFESFKKRLLLHAAVTVIIFTVYLYLLKPTFFANILSLKCETRNNIGNIITENPKDIIKPMHYFISQFKVILHYLWIFIWPFGISVEYDWKLSKNFFAPDSFFPFLGLIFIAMLIIRLLYRNPKHLIGFGALWFAICIAPRSSIVPSPELLVDYKTYTASFGFLFILAAGLIKGFEYLQSTYQQKSNVVQYAFFALIAFTAAGLTMQRNLAWRSGLEFWGNIIENAPGKARAYNNYGVELSQNLKKFAESIPYFQQAINMDNMYPDPLNNIAVAYAQANRIDDAIVALRQSLKINSRYPEGYNNLAAFFLQKKDYENAKKSLETAIKLRPYYGKAYFNMGRILFEQGEQEKGWECFRKCCMEADLDNEMGFNAFAKASAALKKWDEAIFAYKKILSLNTQSPDGVFDLANAYFLAGRLNEALPLYQQLAQQQPNDGRIWYNLGETHLKLDKAPDALACFQRSMPSQSNNPQLYVRIATCHEKIGNPAKAKEVLNQLLARNISASVNNLTKGLITQLDKKYQLA